MKKQFLIILLLCCSAFAKAQYGNSGVELGFTAGPNIGWFSVDDVDAAKNDGVKIGYSYGVLADFTLAPNYYIGTGFTLTSVHGQLIANSVASSSYTITNSYKVNYVEIPLTLKLKSAPSDLGRFYGQFGLGTGFRIGKKGSSEGKRLGEAAESLPAGHLDNVNRIRLSLVMGAGAEWSIGNGMSFLTGLTFNNAFTRTSGNPEISSKYVALNFGIFF